MKPKVLSVFVDTPEITDLDIALDRIVGSSFVESGKGEGQRSLHRNLRTQGGDEFLHSGSEVQERYLQLVT